MKRPTRRRSERGQSVLLLPAGFLIVLMLAAITLEAAAIHLRQRQLVDLADSIANDAVAYGFDVDTFRASGEVRVDEARARSIVGDEIAISLIPDATGSLAVDNGTPPAVVVVLTYDHTLVLGERIMGGLTDTLTATGRAELVLSTP